MGDLHFDCYACIVNLDHFFLFINVGISIMGELHFELILSEIFTRLSAKTVGRLKVLSKKFNVELSSEQFATMHLRHMSKHEQKKFITYHDESMVLFNKVDGQLSAVFSKIIDFPYEISVADLGVISSVCGLILLSDKSISSLIVWNPTTNVIKVLSHAVFGNSYNFQLDTAGIYMDSTGDVKILHLKRQHNVIVPYVYSRKSGLWRSVSFLNETKYNTTDYAWSNGTFCNGALFFTVSKYWSDFQSIIIQFDVNLDVFSLISVPFVQESWVPQCHLLGVSDVLHIFVTNGFAEFSVELWKRESDAWTRVFSFPDVRQLQWGLAYDLTALIQSNSWILMADWGQIIEVFMDNVQLDYLCHADTFRGMRGLLFYESLISPSM